MKVYDANEVTLVVGGILVDRGFADGSFVTLSMVSDAFSDVIGTDGEVTRSKTNDNRAEVKVKLMQSSEINDALSALHELDKLAGNGAGVGPFYLADRQGTSVYSAESCWISKAPDVDFDRQAGAREWTVRIANLVLRHDGGN
jgi:hypothetical protein